MDNEQLLERETKLVEATPFFFLINQFFGIIWVHKSQIVPGRILKGNVTYTRKKNYILFSFVSDA